MATDKKQKMEDQDNLTLQDLQVILDVNKKAIEINIEVERQNEQVISLLQSLTNDVKDVYLEYNNFKYSIQEVARSIEDIKRSKEESRKKIDDIKNTIDGLEKTIHDIEKKHSEIDKNLFRLVVLLGSAGVGIIATLVQGLLK